MIGDRIKKLRTEAKMTQPELAEKLEVTRSAIATYENNTRQPSFHSLVRLAEIFHVSTDYLLLGSNGDFLDVNGLSIEQKMIVVSLVKNFKETNEALRFDIKNKRKIIEKNRKLEEELKLREPGDKRILIRKTLSAYIDNVFSN